MARPQKASPPGLPTRLRQAREEAGLERKDCAAMMQSKFPEFNPDTWGSWETDDPPRNMRFLHFLEACEIVKKSPWWIALGSEDVPSYVIPSQPSKKKKK